MKHLSIDFSGVLFLQFRIFFSFLSDILPKCPALRPKR
ncbi:hypothetical protein STRDD13_00118 [Streptococcus sp. DD13]|nr:hypothetical protein STRDD13_00118 [Streptococcus sp. DD13]